MIHFVHNGVNFRYEKNGNDITVYCPSPVMTKVAEATIDHNMEYIDFQMFDEGVKVRSDSSSHLYYECGNKPNELARWLAEASFYI